LRRSGDWWIAYCPSLDLSTQGKTQEEARKNLIEASELFLISCIERGTLELALKELGFVPLSDTKMTRPPNAFPMRIRIPFGVSHISQDLLDAVTRFPPRC
jgi:predicted RNase H-like HicB family nuclease